MSGGPLARHQLAVHSPIPPAALVAAAASALIGRPALHGQIAATLRERYDARRATFTGSGTTALVLALRLAAGENGTVAFPAYACIDLAAAALRAGVRVRLYDVEPATLGPDLDSLERTLERGVDAVVVAHLYGYPADIRSVLALAARYDVQVIEDAAQGAGGTLDGIPLGGFGALTVLSFGRGKGTTGGNGGALLTRDPRYLGRLAEMGDRLGLPARGWGDAAAAAAQWLLGRPSLYGIPSSIPALRLGEMVYHPAGEPRAMSVAAAAMLRRTLVAAAEEVVVRRAHAGLLERAAAGARRLRLIAPIAGASPGYLRFPVLDDAARAPHPGLGVMRGYPLTLPEQEQLRPCLLPGEGIDARGATELRRSLFTLPTHSLLTAADLGAVAEWLHAASGTDAMPPAGAPVAGGSLGGAQRPAHRAAAD